MGGDKTMRLLQEAEGKFPGVGLRLLDIYFSTTEQSKEERAFWERMQKSLEDRRKNFLNRSCTLNVDGLANLISQQLGNGDWVLSGALLSPKSGTGPPGFRRSQGVTGEDEGGIELTTTRDLNDDGTT